MVENLIIKRGLDEIREHIIASTFVPNEKLNSVKNISNLYKWAKKEGINDTNFFRDTDDQIKKICMDPLIFFKKELKNQFIVYDQIINSFNNVESFFQNGPEIFFDGGKNAFNQNLFNRLFPLLFKKDLDGLLQTAVGFNSKYNKNKFFEYQQIKKDEGNTAILKVKPQIGISHPLSIIYWNLGHYHQMLSNFTNDNDNNTNNIISNNNNNRDLEDKIRNNNHIREIEYEYEQNNNKFSFDTISNIKYLINQNTGEFEIHIKYNSQKEKIYDKFFSKLGSPIKKKAKSSLDEHLKNMQQYQIDIKNKINNETGIVNKTEIEFFQKDEDAAKHAIRTAHLLSKAGIQLGFNKNNLYTATIGALLHDIGKCDIPDEIKNKPGKLTREERHIMESHVLFSAHRLIEKGFSPQIIQMGLFHHECANGSGYPIGLTYEKMPIELLLIQVLDKVEALHSSRIYRPDEPAKSLEKVKNILLEEEIKTGRLHQDLGTFLINDPLIIMKQSGYVPENYVFKDDDNSTYSPLMEDEIGYVKGHHSKFNVEKIPNEVQNLIEKQSNIMPLEIESVKEIIKRCYANIYFEKLNHSPYHQRLFSSIAPSNEIKDILKYDRRDYTHLNDRLLKCVK